MIDQLVSVISNAGGNMLFSAFVAEARSQGLRPELWVRGKRAGQLHTAFDEAGNLIIVAGAKPVSQGGNS